MTVLLTVLPNMLLYIPASQLLNYFLQIHLFCLCSERHTSAKNVIIFETFFLHF